MKVRVDTKGFKPAQERLEGVGLDITRGSAAACQSTAQENARVGHTGDLRRSIRLIPTQNGAYVIGDSPIFAFHEYGTGEYAGNKDSEYPEYEGSEGSKRSEDDIPWVYTPDDGETFYTTKGVRPQPMLRPGLDEGKKHFHKEKKRRGL